MRTKNRFIIKILFLFTFMLSVLLQNGYVYADTADDENIDSALSTDKKEENEKNILVAYFSCTGNTEKLAEYAAKHLDADIFEIEALVPYSAEDLLYYTDCRADREQNDPDVRPEILKFPDSIKQYDTVVIAYPIWHGQAPRIISTFLEGCDFSDKLIIPFCTSGSSEIGSSDENLHELTDNSAEWVKGRRFSSETTADEISAWLDEVYDKNGGNTIKLYINETEIPVKWENNETVMEIVKQLESGDISVEMSMYSDNEQVGSMGRSYTRNDKQTVTHNGDIVLYSGDRIVVFYGSNSWAYTRLGKIKLSEDEVIELLAYGDVNLKLSK